jgi:fatty acid desaturase
MPRLFGPIKRFDALGLGLVAALAALACGAAYAALHFGWFGSLWELAGWLVVGLAFVAAGLGVHANLTPKNTNVHGDARPASEPEAQAAARSDTKAPFHDRTFSD